MEKNNNSPDAGDIRKHLSIDGIPAKAYDAVINGTSRKIGFKILVQLLAAGAISQEIYAKWAEKLVIAAGGDITPVVNENENMKVGDTIHVTNMNDTGVFTQNSYLFSTDDALSIRDNKTLQEIDSVPGDSADKPVDLGNGDIAFVQWDSVAKDRQIHIRLNDGTDQIIPLNASIVHVLESSNETLYVLMEGKTDGKSYIRLFVKGVKGKYEENSGKKIELQGGPDRMIIHNGKIAVFGYNKVYVYNQDNHQLEYTETSLEAMILLGARPGTNEIYLVANFPGQLISFDLATHQIKVMDTEEAIVGSDYGIGECGFSKDGSRLMVYTVASDMPEQYVFVLKLNPDGTIAEITKSPAVTESAINDCAVDTFDTDNDANMNSTDNCSNVKNPEQLDANSNGIGDACENPAEYAASQGYDNYQEVSDTGHTIYSTGDVVVDDQGDTVQITPIVSDSGENIVQIINNGQEQTDQLQVYIPPETNYSIDVSEGSVDLNGDIFNTGESTEGTTPEEGIIAGVSGTDITMKFTKTAVVEEQQPEQPETVEEFLEEINGETVDETTIAEETQAEEIAIPDEIIEEQEISEETTQTEETSAEETAQAEETSTDVIETKPDTIDAAEIQPDNQETYAEISTEPDHKNGGGGGCSINTVISGLESGTLVLTTLGVLGARYLKTIVYNTRRKFSKALKG